MPIILNLRHDRLLPEAVVVDRTSIFGNPFRIGRDGDRAEVIRKYRAYLLSQPEMVAQVRRLLKGKDLACWCHPLACHAEVLMEVANKEDTMSERRVLVCGQRTYGEDETRPGWVVSAEAKALTITLDEMHAEQPITHIITGMAPGADTLAWVWGKEHDVQVLEFPADWTPGPLTRNVRVRRNGDRYDPAAGFRRNQQMLDEGHPTEVVAFFHTPIERSRGTKMMVELSRKANVPVTIIETR
jgi:hypothetical protein